MCGWGPESISPERFSCQISLTFRPENVARVVPTTSAARAYAATLTLLLKILGLSSKKGGAFSHFLPTSKKGEFMSSVCYVRYLISPPIVNRF